MLPSIPRKSLKLPFHLHSIPSALTRSFFFNTGSGSSIGFGSIGNNCLNTSAVLTTRLYRTEPHLERPCVVFLRSFPALSTQFAAHAERKDAWMNRLWPLLLLVSLAPAQETRHFAFQYRFTVKNVPAGERLRVWMPAAHSDEFQEVKVVSATGDLGWRRTHESRFGNEMYYAETGKEWRGGVDICILCIEHITRAPPRGGAGA